MKTFSDNHSKGCQICQEGGWLCVFLTHRCTADCPFCPTRFKKNIVSAFGGDPQTILNYINQGAFRGLSFSGGDCFLVFDQLKKWLTFFKKERPDMYYWAYTNGLEVKEGQMETVAQSGLNELRFNIAATNYQSVRILKIIARAVKLFDHVAVEIPSIPYHYEQLVAVLPELERLGVHFLNLHEFLLMPDDPIRKQAVAGTFILNKHSKIQYDAYSLQNTERVRQFCKAKGFSILINQCSLQKKENQMLYRRLAMGAIVREPHERLTEDGLLETLYRHPGDVSSEEIKNMFHQCSQDCPIDGQFIHPNCVELSKMNKQNQTAAALFFVPPMSFDEKRVLVKVKILKNVD